MCGGGSSASAIRRLILAGIMVLMGALAALTLPAYGLTFDFMAWFLRTFARSAGSYVGFNVISQLIAALIMIPASFCAGMTLPLLTRELMRRGAGERAIGFIYSANTFGAILGVVLTIHVLMPRIGIKGVILTGAAIHMALGLSRFLSRAVRRNAPREWPWEPVIGVFALVLIRGPSGSVAHDLRGVSHWLRDFDRRGSRRVPAGRQDRDHQPGREGRLGDDRHQRQARRGRANGARRGVGR